MDIYMCKVAASNLFLWADIRRKLKKKWLLEILNKVQREFVRIDTSNFKKIYTKSCCFLVAPLSLLRNLPRGVYMQKWKIHSTLPSLLELLSFII